MQVIGAYNIRQTGNGIGGFMPKNSEPTYVGGTFSWNQLVPDANIHIERTTSINWTSFSGINFSVVANHKYLFRLTGKTVANGQIGVRDIPNNVVYRPGSGYALIYSSGYTSTSTQIQGSWDTGDTDAYFNAYDLTLMLGSTIADYAYTLESGNAGDGVAWLQSQGFFKEDYYAYDAGSLQNVETEKAINTGIDPLNIHTYTLGHATLRGLPKMDASHNIYYDGDTYESSGKITRRFKVVHLGDQNWLYVTSGTYPFFQFQTGSSGAALLSNKITIVCTKYEAVANISNYDFRTNDYDKKICVNLSGGSTTRYIQVQDSAYTDAPTFKTAMNGVYLIYQSVSETTESAASFESLMFAEAGGTEQLVDYAFNHGTRDVEIPVGAKTDYGVIRFAGYLIAVRDSQDNFTPIPLEYMRFESYTIAPEQRLDLDSTRDTTGLLHRTVLAHTATKVTFNVPSMESWRIQELLDYFRTAFQQTNGDTLSHKLELKYYDEWADEYKTGIMYMPDIQFQIRNIDRAARLINYQETKITFIEY